MKFPELAAWLMYFHIWQMKNRPCDPIVRDFAWLVDENTRIEICNDNTTCYASWRYLAGAERPGHNIDSPILFAFSSTYIVITENTHCRMYKSANSTYKIHIRCPGPQQLANNSTFQTQHSRGVGFLIRLGATGGETWGTELGKYWKMRLEELLLLVNW